MVVLPHNVPVSAVETALRAQCRYRKIAGDVCEGGEEGLFERFKAPCCGNNTLFPTRPTEVIADTFHGDDNLDKLVAALAATGSLLGVAGLVAFVFLVLFILAVV